MMICICYFPGSGDTVVIVALARYVSNIFLRMYSNILDELRKKN